MARIPPVAHKAVWAKPICPKVQTNLAVKAAVEAGLAEVSWVLIAHIQGMLLYPRVCHSRVGQPLPKSGLC